MCKQPTQAKGFLSFKKENDTIQTPAPQVLKYNNMTKEKQKILINFKKVRSLSDKLIEMVETEKYCIDIMQQNLAAVGLLKSAHQMLLDNHLNTCFKHAMSSNNEKIQKRMTEEILKVNKLANK
jgi:DNA-binding FrmR family transcriptional regulator